MNEQIVITKNNHGIEIIVNFIDSKKKPVNLEKCTVEVSFVNPENLKTITMEAQILDRVNGKVSVVLTEDMTKLEGLWSTYWSAITENGFVTAQESIYYYVLPEYGGAE